MAGVLVSVKERSTRRAVLAAGASLAAELIVRAQPQSRRIKPLPRVGEFTRFNDPATEAVVVRLTAQNGNSHLPFPWQHFISVKGKFLLFASDRGGSFAPYLLDLASGVPHQLSEASAMRPRSLCLDGSERVAFFLDGDKLQEFNLNSRRARTVADGVDAFALGPSRAALTLMRDGSLQVLGGPKLADKAGSPIAIAPSGKQCVFVRAGLPNEDCELWLAGVENASDLRPKLLAQGRISSPFWSPDSESIYFLRRVVKSGVTLSEIHSVSVSNAVEETVAPTSQFGAFAPNANASVFVGASASKAQPNVVLLLRKALREMTVCEHHASSADPVFPVFSPDSRRVYFESDREGKTALYATDVQQLVEST